MSGIPRTPPDVPATFTRSPRRVRRASRRRRCRKTVVVTQIPHGREQWPTTTHVWAYPVDAEHLAAIAADPDRFAAGGLTHLVLEVLAYAAEEAEARGVIGRADVVVRPDGSVEVCDDGRGTQTRRDETGQVIRKPVMATRDVRFFGTDAERLADGLPRNGMSAVAALSTSATTHQPPGRRVLDPGVPSRRSGRRPAGGRPDRSDGHDGSLPARSFARPGRRPRRRSAHRHLARRGRRAARPRRLRPRTAHAATCRPLVVEGRCLPAAEAPAGGGSRTCSGCWSAPRVRRVRRPRPRPIAPSSPVRPLRTGRKRGRTLGAGGVGQLPVLTPHGSRHRRLV